ncbi:LuxR C-terminal-related transcriptional regulator [Actinomyces slackii]|uniref:Response regulator protein vraR n=1 Tax=Actinomyces slackii TaxID=52774 RepID=A0A448KD33_9ACTO|nr:LuxR C-terminal-related transcriptional regulator [Actinomyces slackii]VEG74844.1 Response regulator protein vraR [Actinomyces slackii]
MTVTRGTTAPAGGPLCAEAMVGEDMWQALADPLGLLASRVGQDIIGIVRASMRLDLGSTGFMLHGGSSGALRVRIRRPDCAAGIRELVVEDNGLPWGLTSRQLEVLTLLALGYSNPEIASLLAIRPKTVGAHVEEIFARLGAPNRTLATVMAVEQQALLLDVVPTTSHAPGLSICRLKHEWMERRADPAAPPSGERAAPGEAVRQRAVRGWGSSGQRAPLIIGSIVPDCLPGEAQDMAQGAELAIRRRNAREGVHGRRIEHCVIGCDAFDSESTSRALAQLSDRGADAVVIGYNLDYPRTESFLDRAGEIGIPVIHASTSRRAIDCVADNPGSLGNIFHICAGDELYGPGILALVDHIEDLRGQSLRGMRLALIEPPPGMDVMGPLTAQRLHDRGIVLEPVPRRQPICDAAERARVVESLGRLDPDIVVSASFLDQQLLVDVLAAVRRRRRPPLMIALFTPSLAGFVERNAELAEGLIWSTQTGTYGDVLGRRFRQDLEAAFGRAPGHSQAGVHYDAVSMLMRSWLEAAHPRDRRDVIQHLRHQTHRGVNGSYWLASPGQAPLSYPYESLDGSLSQAQLTFQVRQGRHVVVLPEAYAQAPVSLKGTCLDSSRLGLGLAHHD